MIQEFSVQNYLSICDKQTISFVASADNSLSDQLIAEPMPGVRLLRMSMIYGANASGKTNLLQAIRTLWYMLFVPQDNDHLPIPKYQPFAQSQSEPTRFEIVFWDNSRCYQYWIEYDRMSIIYEKMMYTAENGVLSLVYEHTKGETIQFGSTLGIKDKQRDELNLETLANHTVLSTLGKKNIEVPKVLTELYELAKNNAIDQTSANVRTIAEQADRNPEIKKFMLQLLNAADVTITDFTMVAVPVPIEFSKEIIGDTSLSELTKIRYLRPSMELLFTHVAKSASFQIHIDLESAGTSAYFRLARLLFDVKTRECVLLEDELEESLHYELLLHYMKIYLQAAGRSQLIFTTHNQELLDEDWMVRRDMVWFTEKDPLTSATYIKRASDMGILKDVSLKNAYRSGTMGAIPALGSVPIVPLLL